MNEPRTAGPNELGVSIAAGPHEPERLLLIGTPSNGRVHVREWSESNWAGPAHERDESVDTVYALCERAYAERRRLSTSLREIKAWLDGSAR